jgi:hypothetical protein
MNKMRNIITGEIKNFKDNVDVRLWTPFESVTYPKLSVQGFLKHREKTKPWTIQKTTVGQDIHDRLD